MRVSIIDGIAAHYRLSIFQKLSKQSEPEYSFFASNKPLNGIRTIDTKLAYLPISEGGIRWKFIDNIVIFGRIFWQKGVISIAAKGNFEIFVFPGEFQIISTWLAVFICKKRGKKTVFWGHGSYGNEKKIKKFIRSSFNRLPDAYLVYNEMSKNILVSEGLEPGKLFLINNSLNYDLHLEIRNKIKEDKIKLLRNELFPKNSSFPIVVFIGRLTKGKKIDQLIKSIDLLKKRGKMVNCLVIGIGEQEGLLMKMVKDLEIIDQVCFYGSNYDEYINGQLLYIADCCVSPGNVGLTAIHSMTFGTPVITHNELINQMPEVSTIIENITGELFDVNNIDHLADKIQKILFESGKENYKKNCMKIIDELYNPYFQVNVFNNLIKYLMIKDTECDN
jgi:glycosyltransferase involved in cell wall biosynthesis